MVISTAEFAEGIYFVQITNGDTIATEQLMVIK
jgi:hypothetical protein